MSKGWGKVRAQLYTHGLRSAMLASLLLLPTACAVQPAELSGTVETTTLVHVDGPSIVDANAGVLHFRGAPTTHGQMRIVAERVEASTEWYRGYQTSAPVRPTIWDPNDGSGRDTHVFTNATVDIVAPEATPEILVLFEDATMQATAAEGFDTASVTNEPITRVEYSDGARSTPGTVTPGFHYQTPGSWARLCGIHGSSISGTFQVFVNNVTIHVADSDQGSWEHWTGYRETNATGPVTEFESRVTVLNVAGGVLTTSAPDPAFCAYGPGFAAAVSGAVQADRVTGVLQLEDVMLEFDDVPLEMHGTGSLDLAARIKQGTINGVTPSAADAALSIEPSGTFTVTETTGLHAVAVADPESGEWSTAWAWIAVLSLLAPLAVYGSRHVMRRGSPLSWRREGPTFKPGAITPEDLEALTCVMRNYIEPGPWTSQHTQEFSRGMARALDAMLEERFEAAVAAAGRLVRAYPSSRDALRLFAEASLEARYYDQAADAYDRLNEMCQRAVPEVIQGLARASWKAGRRDEANAALVEYAEADPEAAAGLVVRPGLIGLGIDAVDELCPDMLYAWTMRAWDDHRRQVATYVFAALCRRSPQTTLHLVGDERYTSLWRSVFAELGLDTIKALVRNAIVHGRLALARDAFAELAHRNEDVAVGFAREPGNEMLLDDVRVAYLADRAGTAPRRDGDSAASDR